MSYGSLQHWVDGSCVSRNAVACKVSMAIGRKIYNEDCSCSDLFRYTYVDGFVTGVAIP